MSDQQQYGYTRRLQTKILALMMREPDFLAQHRDVLKAEYFEYDPHQVICGLVLDYFDQYHKRPTNSALADMIKGYMEENEVDTGSKREVRQLARKILEINLDDAQYVRDKVIRFGRRQSLREGVMEVVELLERDDDLEDAQAIIENALRVGSHQDLGLEPFQQLDRIKKALLSERDDGDRRRRIPTGLPSLDRRLKGGLGRGELGVVLGSTGRGKSILMTQLLAKALSLFLNAAYYTIGDLTETDVAIRTIARLTGYSMDQLVNEKFRKFEKRLNSLLDNPNLIVKYLNPGQHTVQTIRTHLGKLYALRGWKPDLVIVDYADKLLDARSINAQRRTGRREYRGDEQQSNVYDDLISTARDFDCAMWTPGQVKVGHHEEDQFGIDGAAGSWGKMSNVDVGMTLCQTAAERKNNRARLFVDKVRRGEDAFTVWLDMDKPRMLITETDPPSRKKNRRHETETD